jgi:hypothetical protein
LRSNSKKSTLYLHYFISLGKHILVEKWDSSPRTTDFAEKMSSFG